MIVTQEEVDELLAKPDVQRAMEIRCEEEGHDFEHCCTPFFRIYQRCRWCGRER